MSRGPPRWAVAILLAGLIPTAPARAQGRPSRPGKTEEPAERAPRQPIPDAPPRSIDVRVTEKGFEPALITLHPGERVRLVFRRETDATCAKVLVIDEFLVWNVLPLKERFATTFTAGRVGEFPYTCPTREIQGIIKVEDAPPARATPPAPTAQ